MKRFYIQIEFGNRTFIILDYRYRFLISGGLLVVIHGDYLIKIKFVKDSVSVQNMTQD
jgi:hypothetical protein